MEVRRFKDGDEAALLRVFFSAVVKSLQVTILRKKLRRGQLRGRS